MNPATRLTALAELGRDIDACYRGAKLLEAKKAMLKLASAYTEVIKLVTKIEGSNS